ncbi:MAG: dihydrodipicolinate synthase family protein [Thermomicrobiales bacterium]|nr:dihydrodipicolinate synthase family protein [Thermomicrobiales bacterium]
MTELSGCIPILCTPFDAHDAIDFESLRAQIDWVIAEGAAGVATLALASEGYKLTEAERDAVSLAVAEHVAGRVPVVVSADGAGNAVAVDRAKRAVASGADALMVLPPYLVKPSPASLRAYYLAIANAVPVPIMIQDAPQLTGVAMGPALWAEIGRAAENEISIKAEGTPQGATISAAIEQSGGTMRVFCGWGGLGILDALERGAVGSMPAANFTGVFAGIHAAWDAGNRERARALLESALPYSVWAMQSLDHSVTTAKRELRQRGIIANDRVRQPATELDAIGMAQLDEWIGRGLTSRVD